MTGTAVTMTNAIAGLIMGYLVDRTNRKYLLVTCVLLWNAICCLNAIVSDFSQLLTLRILFAVVCSVHVPACVSLIQDLFRHKRAMANSIFVTAVSFGVGAANLTSIMNQKIGWRNSALACSSFGVIVALLVMTIEEPKRIDCTANQIML